MNKWTPYLVILFAALGLGALLLFRDVPPTMAPDVVVEEQTEQLDEPVIEEATEPVIDLEAVTDALVPDGPPSRFVLEDVPYIPEAPGNVWEGPWKNGCEEASVAMVEFFYTGNFDVTIDEAKTFMQMLFDTQDELWGQNANSDVSETHQLINGYTSFTAEIVENPSIEDIKNELREGRPVIVPLNGFTLDNPHIPFLPTGSGYHMLTVVGYDDVIGHFIVHDDGDLVTGEFHRYEYNHFMNSIADYVHGTQKTNGPKQVLFTQP